MLFESREFTQERDGDGWIFRDEVTGATVHHGAPVNWWNDTQAADPPHRWRAEARPIDIDDYIPGVAWLRELFQASVRTGRPVIWS